MAGSCNRPLILRMGGAISPLPYAFTACTEIAIPFHRDKDVLYEEVELEELLVGKNFSTTAEHGTNVEPTVLDTCWADFKNSNSGGIYCSSFMLF